MKRNQPTDVKNLNLQELEAWVVSLGESRYRARQIMEWVYHHNASSFDEMTNLPKEFRSKISTAASISKPNVKQIETSSDGTHKFLFELKDGHHVESVLIPEKKHRTICLSTQVGCALGCKFCRSGKHGWIRNLDASEIVNQVCAIQNDFLAQNETINIVLMGMGEPLANYPNTLKTLQILTDPLGLHVSHRRITVSTAGLIPQIEKLGRELPVNLAISLNAANDSLRSFLMPINQTYPLDELIQVAARAFLPSRKRITFEYILIKDVNDSLQDAKELTSLLKSVRCKINLIPFNEHDGVEFRRPDDQTVERFRDYLVAKHCTVMVRESKGGSISAACGQLARV